MCQGYDVSEPSRPVRPLSKSSLEAPLCPERARASLWAQNFEREELENNEHNGNGRGKASAGIYVQRPEGVVD